MGGNDEKALAKGTGQKIIEYGVRSLGIGTSLLLQLGGQPTEAALAAGLTEPSVLTVSQLYQSVGERKARLIGESAQRVGECLAERGLEPDAEAMDELLQQAIPALGDAETMEKRRIIEDVLVGAADRIEDHKVRAAAMDAIELVSQMSPLAAFVFAALPASLRQVSGRSNRAVVRGSALNDIPDGQFWRVLNQLADLGLVDHHGYNGANPDPDEQFSCKLTTQGEWLATWLVAHPPAEEQSGPS